MMRHAAALMLGASLLGGCMMRAPARPHAPPPERQPIAEIPQGNWQVTQLKQLPAPSGTTPPPVQATAANGVAVPPGMQFLYGSGEAAALSQQAYGALASYVRARASDLQSGSAIWSVVLSPSASLAEPKFTACEGKKPAIVLDIDETTLLNLGYEAADAQRNAPYDQKRWDRWEQTGADAVRAVPGAVKALADVRAAGVTVIFNSNRLAANATQTEAALDHAGVGPAKHGETLWLRGDDGTDSNAKDGRRWQIAERYCVIALVGDQLGDFSDLFADKALNPKSRRDAAMLTGIAPLWGAGWFVLPNPVYGSGLKGSFDEVFPADKRWSDPAEETK